MLRDFVRDSAIYGGASLLVRGLSLLLLPFYTRVLSTEEYGLVDLATVFITLVLLTVALEVSQGVARLFADADPDDRVGYASTALWFSIGAYALFVAVALPLAPELSAILFESRERADLMRLVIVAAAPNGIFQLLINQLRWRLQPMAYAAGSLTFAFVSIGATIVLVLVADLGVVGVLLGQLIGAMAGGIVCLLLARDLYRLRFDRDKLMEMLRFSLPLVPSSVGVFVTLYIDRFAIKELMTVDDVGVFGIGYRIASVVSLLVLAVQTAITPLVYARYRDPETPAQLARVFRYFVAGALVLAVGLSLFAREILVVVTTPAFYGGAVVVPLLAPALLLSAMYVFAPGLGIAKRTGTQASITLAGAVLNTVLNFVLIPVWGIIGAAAATLISAAVIFAAYMITSQRLYFVPHGWGRLALATALAALASLVAVLAPLPSGPALLMKVVLMAATVGMVVRVGLIDPADVREAVRGLRAAARVR
ncbi:MAG: oligosaccharide flippase family protein [Chloroflexota bacterium]